MTTTILYSGICPLYLAALYSESAELLEILIKLDASITKKKPHSNGLTPLEKLYRRKQFPKQKDMIQCLIEVDSSVAVIENRISCSIQGHFEDYRPVSDIKPGSIGHHTLTMVEILLKANPEAAKCEHQNLVHNMCQYTKGSKV